MRKRIAGLVVCLMFILTLLPSIAFAVDTPESMFKWNGNIVAGYLGTDNDVVITSRATSIGDRAFSNFYSLTSIMIPNTVTSIGSNAFANCNNLTSITIPNSVTSIGEGAFSNCSNLTSITIPTSVTFIGDNVFSYCGHNALIIYCSPGSYAETNAKLNNIPFIADIKPVATPKATPVSTAIPQPTATATAMPIPKVLPNDFQNKVMVNGKYLTLDVAPSLIEGRMLVPLRAIFEALSAEVEWIGSLRTVKVAKGTTNIEIQIDNKIAKVNGKEVTLDVPAMIINNRTLVPVRFISESVGANVKWDGENNTAIVTTENEIHSSIATPAATTTTMPSSSSTPVAIATPRQNGKILYSYYNGDNYDIYTMDEDGTNIKQITNGNERDIRANFSKDATKIVFTKNFDGSNGTASSDCIYTMNADGSNVEYIAAGTYGDFSPDGSKLAISRFTGIGGIYGGDGIYIYDLATKSEDEFLYKGTSSTAITDLDWSADGNSIIFSNTFTDIASDTSSIFNSFGSKNSYIQKINTKGEMKPLKLTDNFNETIRSARYSPDCKKFSYDAIGSIYIENADGTSNMCATQGIFSVWSPDGKRILFTKTSQDKSELFIADIDGKNEKCITSGTGYYYSNDWK